MWYIPHVGCRAHIALVPLPGVLPEHVPGDVHVEYLLYIHIRGVFTSGVELLHLLSDLQRVCQTTTPHVMSITRYVTPHHNVVYLATNGHV